MRIRRLLIFTILAYLLLCHVVISSETVSNEKIIETPVVIQNFIASLSINPSAKEFYQHLDDNLWSVYKEGPHVKEQLINYLQSAETGPGLAFSAIALITFHDPKDAKIILERALDENISDGSRWYLLNAAPYVLSMGDVWYSGDGKLDKKSNDFISSVLEASEESMRHGVGTVHAKNLVKLYNEKLYPKDATPDLGLAKWHISAYLLGTISLKDFKLFENLLNPKEGLVYINVINALSYAANKDFVADLRNKKQHQISNTFENKLAMDAKDWWENYLTEHPNGEWKPAVITGFNEAGYAISLVEKSDKNSKELMRALDSDNQIHVYNACKLLNYIYSKQFDIERIFLGEKYAAGPFSPTSKMGLLQRQLISYWKTELTRVISE